MDKKNTSHAGSTQKFIEIVNVIDDIVILMGGRACIVVEVQATNFSLLSNEEREVKIISYGGLLNSLSFPIQILVRNKRIDITSYIKLLDTEIQKAAGKRAGLSDSQNVLVLRYITQYRDFIQELVKVNTVLDKKFYVVIPFSNLEAGLQGAKGMITQNPNDENFIEAAKASLHSKVDTLHNQLERLNLRAKTLGKEDLIKLYYGSFNELQPVSNEFGSGASSAIVKSIKSI